MKPRQTAVRLKTGDILRCVLQQPYSLYAYLEPLPTGGNALRVRESAEWIFKTRRGGIIFEEDVAEFMPSDLAAPEAVYYSFQDFRGVLMTQIRMRDGVQFHLEGGDRHTFFFLLPPPYSWKDFEAVVPYEWDAGHRVLHGLRHFVCVMTSELTGA